MSIFTEGPRDGIIDNLAVLIAVANADVSADRPRRSVVDNARRTLCAELGIQRLDEPVEEIAARLRQAFAAVDWTALASWLPGS